MKKLIRLLRVLLFVIHWHKGQKRKYTGHPYFFHLVSVALKVYTIEKRERYIVVALCHDLFEDTKCTAKIFVTFLKNVGYSEKKRARILEGVFHLTDEFTTERYPDLNRSKRKELETYRLSKIPKWCQTIKYADLMDNTSSIVTYDKTFAKTYLEEKEAILKVMRKGNTRFLVETIVTLEQAKNKL